MKRLLFGWLAVGAVSAIAVPLEWTKWAPLYRYVDMDVNCASNSFSDYVYFGVQRTASGVAYAELKDELSEFSQSFAAVPAALLPGIEVNGTVKQVTLDGNLIQWILRHRGSLWECQPSVPLKSMSPGLVTLKFSPGLDELGKPAWVSNQVKVSGYRQDGTPYQLTLSIRQTLK